MNRRDFIQSTGKGLLASAGLVFGHTAAGVKSVAVTPPGTDHSVTLFLCGDVMTGRGIESRVELQEDQSLILDWGGAVLQ
jgi:hypothetical protein